MPSDGAQLATLQWTPPVMPLPSGGPAAITDMAVSYALPETVRMIMFVCGIAMVAYVIRRMSGTGQ